MSRCRSCRAEIIWVITARGGRRMPLDAEPTPDGNVIFDTTGRAAVVSGETLATLRPEIKRYMPHHATCPHADQWKANR